MFVVICMVLILLAQAYQITLGLSTYRKINDLNEKYNRRREGGLKSAVVKASERPMAEQIPINFSTGISNN
jgi:hypothetical protein